MKTLLFLMMTANFVLLGLSLWGGYATGMSVVLNVLGGAFSHTALANRLKTEHRIRNMKRKLAREVRRKTRKRDD